jgi:hypothetical protein
MMIVLFICRYAVAAGLLVPVMRAKNASIPPSVRRMEDAEQMRAVRGGLATRRTERDPFLTMS